jgi:hypothetical protein
MYFLGTILLTEPIGLFALLGVPITLIIFLFHRQAKRIPVSTLFLVQKKNSIDSRGRSLDTIKNSLSLWMTLFFVLLLTWVLSRPKFVSEKYVQKIVVVLDSSVSMRAFLPKGLETVLTEFDRINRLSSKTDWILLDSSTHATPLYEGREVSEASKALENWSPSLGTHSPLAQLEYAKVVAGSSGMVLFVSDREVIVPEGVSLLAIGSKVDNVGFVGISEYSSDSGDTIKRVLIKNYASSPQNRTLQIGNSPPQHLVLGPQDITRVLLPNDIDSQNDSPVELHLSRDDFPIDDILLLLRAKPKILRVAIVTTDTRYAVLRRMLSIEDSIAIVDGSNAPDVVIGESILSRKEVTRATIFFPPPRAESELLSRVPITAVHHPFTEGLQFEGLLLPPCRPFVPSVGDKVLVWQGETPMIIALKGESIYLNFDLSNDRISRHPALVVLLHRYLASIRQALPLPETKSFDGGQILDIPQIEGRDVLVREKEILSGIESERVVSHASAKSLRAPVLPSSFSVKVGGVQLLTGVSNFTDPRESDFADARRITPSLDNQLRTVHVNAEKDPFRNVWIVLAILAALASWIRLKDVISLLRKRS